VASSEGSGEKVKAIHLACLELSVSGWKILVVRGVVVGEGSCDT
jgi:hypothetical protein